MARKNDPVEALAKVLWEVEVNHFESFWPASERTKWFKADKMHRIRLREYARAAIAHLKQTERETMRQHVKQLNRDTRTKRGAKRGK